MAIRTVYAVRIVVKSNHLIQNKCRRFALRESGPSDGGFLTRWMIHVKRLLPNLLRLIRIKCVLDPCPWAGAVLTGHCESNHLIQNKCSRFALRESGPSDGFQTA